MKKSESSKIEVFALLPQHKKEADRVLARAFFYYPMIEWILPDIEHRQKVLQRYLGATIGDCLNYGKVYTTKELTGIAAWSKPNNNEYLRRVIRSGLLMAPFYLGLRAFYRAYRNSSYLNSIRKRYGPGEPYWHLSALGILPEHQGKGIGGALLRPILEQADKENYPCYLETHLDNNLGFYRNHGFDTLHAGRIEQGPPVWTMVRLPK